ncbi:Orf14 [Pseudomonas syringae pv. apii]|uniref:Orf14 n=1 Tax=Pseudomonas syringae pv. apii TaxID=81036 RepID=A0A3M3N2Q4_9PSED|nr:Orf14 [Pseudomonas syringae pv. apii]RMN57912.1 Orf14 [Pseudomonas syringae pv. apii]RMN93474.1 Orf14 [Pseudomonas syringae pv. apii]
MILPKRLDADRLTAGPEQSAAFINAYPADRLTVAT